MLAHVALLCQGRFRIQTKWQPSTPISNAGINRHRNDGLAGPLSLLGGEYGLALVPNVRLVARECE